MRFLNAVILGMFASLVVIAAFATSASAVSPQLFFCEKYGEGEFTNNNCSSGGSGEFERAPLEAEGNIEFTSTGGATVMKTSSLTLECTAETAHGETNGPKMFAKITIKLTGCKSALGQCHSSGAAAGEIVTKSLKGTLVFLKKSQQPPVGVVMEPEAGTEFSPELVCGFLKSKVTGSVIGEVTPANQSKESGEVLYKENTAKTGQQWTQVEEEGTSHELSAFGEKVSLTLAEKVVWANAEQLGVATEELKALKFFVAKNGKAGYPLVLSATLTSAQQVFVLGKEESEIACNTLSFVAPTLKRRLINVVLTPTLTKCTFTNNGRGDPNVRSACDAFELLSGGIVLVPKCTFEVTDLVVGGVTCKIVFERAEVSARYKSIMAPAELEVNPVTTATLPKFGFGSTLACGLSPASGAGANEVKFVVKGTFKGAAEGFEIM
jgi:hypothetical protein